MGDNLEMKNCDVKLSKMKHANKYNSSDKAAVLSKTLKDINDMKRKHEEIVKTFEHILEYLSVDHCDIQELDHQKLEDLSCFLVKGVSLFTDLSDHIKHLQNSSNTDLKRDVSLINEDIVDDEKQELKDDIDIVKTEDIFGDVPFSMEQLDFVEAQESVYDDNNISEEDTFTTTHHEEVLDDQFKIVSIEGVASVKHLDVDEEAMSSIKNDPVWKPDISNHSKKRDSGIKQKKILYTCDECGKSFKQRRSVKRHKEFHHEKDKKEEVKRQNKENFQCDECKKNFMKKWEFEKHMQWHFEKKKKIENAKNLYCEKCDKKFTKICDFKDHMKEHFLENAVSCDICHKQFKDEGGLKTHQANFHLKPKPRNYVCDHCAKAFPSNAELNRHIRIHTQERPFKCEECGKSFKRSHGLTYHLLMHTGIKEFECDVCHRQFLEKRGLDNHYRLHTGEKPFVCEVCDKAFHLKGEKAKHMKKKHDIHKEYSDPL